MSIEKVVRVGRDNTNGRLHPHNQCMDFFFKGWHELKHPCTALLRVDIVRKAALLQNLGEKANLENLIMRSPYWFFVHNMGMCSWFTRISELSLHCESEAHTAVLFTIWT